MIRQATLTAASAAVALGLFAGTADAAPPNVVDCDANNGNSIQAAVDFAFGPTTIFFAGTCDETVTITKDDIALDGQGVGTVSGSIVFDGAHRGAVRNATVTGPGSGIVATNGASVTIEDNSVTDNVADGIGVFNGAYASITNNTITGNGRADHFDAGIQVARAVARGQGNTISDNDYAGVEVFNFGTYRTGSLLSPSQPDNDGPFETISVGASGVVAVELGQMSFVDIRQVTVTGNVLVGRQSMLQVRGDSVGDSKTCSLIDGDLTVFGFHSSARLRFVDVTGTVSGDISGPVSCP